MIVWQTVTDTQTRSSTLFILRHGRDLLLHPVLDLLSELRVVRSRVGLADASPRYKVLASHLVFGRLRSGVQLRQCAHLDGVHERVDERCLPSHVSGSPWSMAVHV